MELFVGSSGDGMTGDKSSSAGWTSIIRAQGSGTT